MNEDLRRQRLIPPSGRVRAVLDTDTFNEVDDQFALAYALCSPEALDLEAVYAAPFSNERAGDPEEGMEKSYDEILNVFARLGRSAQGLVLKGARGYLPAANAPCENEATADLVRRALALPEGEVLYVMAIGAITNVASALLIEPTIRDRIVVVWLGGHSMQWPHTREFNLKQDIHAARVVFDSGVPLMRIPCNGVASHLITTVAELRSAFRGNAGIGAYLTDIVRDYAGEAPGCSKVIWDIAAVAWLIQPAWVPSELTPSPQVTDALTWADSSGGHTIRCATHVYRDPVFGDLFAKLAAEAGK